jgi:hypothetical protein
LRNIEVVAEKGPGAWGLAEYRVAVEELLSLGTVKTKLRTIPASEEEMLAVWMRMWENAYFSSSESTQRLA